MVASGGASLAEKTRGVWLMRTALDMGIVVGEGWPVERADKGIKVFGRFQWESPEQDCTMLGRLSDALVTMGAAPRPGRLACPFRVSDIHKPLEKRILRALAVQPQEKAS